MEEKGLTAKKDGKVVAKLVIGSVVGICFFIVPFSIGGKMTILLSYVKDLISAPVKSLLPIIVMVLAIGAAVVSLTVTLAKPKNMSDYLRGMFVVSPFTLVVRVLAAVVAVIAYFQVGPHQIWDEYTGGLILFDLMPSLLILFPLAISMLPLLTEYGAMQLVGGVLQPIFKPLFRLPGKSAILALSSWFGSGSVGMLAMDEEYKKGRYTGREAAIICFGFCVISFPNMFIYSSSIGGLDESLSGMFFLALVIAGVVSTMIIARIPPISRLSNEYYPEAPKAQELEDAEAQSGSAFDKAYLQAQKAPGIVKMWKHGLKTSFKMYMDVFPLIIFLATIVLVVSEYTPVFNIIAIPFVPVLNLMGIPEAALVAPALFTGFADLLLPFIAATGMQSQLAKFIICVVGTIQVICMSETGAIMLKSKIPVKFMDLVFIFLEKTVIALVIGTLIGRLIGLT